MPGPGVTRTSPRNSTFPLQVVIRQWSSLTACRTSFMWTAWHGCERSGLTNSGDNTHCRPHRVLPAAGKPIGFSKDGKRHIIFRTPEKWPSREPFVFDLIERRQPDYQQYRGPRNTLVWAWDNGERFRRLEPIGKPPSQVVGNPCAIHDAKRDRHYLAFRNAGGHVQEAILNEGSPAAGEPSGLVSGRVNTMITQLGSR